MPHYDDGRIEVNDRELIIHRYYPWGRKRVDLAAIRKVSVLPLVGKNAIRRWRLWGSGDFVYWWNLDLSRPKKRTALVLDLGKHVAPVITPDQPDVVATLLGGATTG